MSAPYLVRAFYEGFKPYASEPHDSKSHATRAALSLLQEADEAREAGELSATVIVEIHRRGQLWAQTVVEKRIVHKPEPPHRPRHAGQFVKACP